MDLLIAVTKQQNLDVLVNILIYHVADLLKIVLAVTDSGHPVSDHRSLVRTWGSGGGKHLFFLFNILCLLMIVSVWHAKVVQLFSRT